MTDPTPAHLVAVRSDRGFTRLPPIATADGAMVRVYESSMVNGPHVWLHHVHGSDAVPAHLTVQAARELAEQLLFLVENHYQTTETGSEDRP